MLAPTKRPSKRVIIETPYDQANKRNRNTSLVYTKACLQNSIDRGEVPHSSEILGLPDKLAVYVDLGITSEMALAIETAINKGLEIEYRSLPADRLNLVPDVDLVRSILSKRLMFGKTNKLELKGLPDRLSREIKSGGFRNILLQK